MYKDTLRNFSANHLHGRHSSDLRSYFGDYYFCLIVKKSRKILQIGNKCTPHRADITKAGLSEPEYFTFFHVILRRKEKYYGISIYTQKRNLRNRAARYY